jgi:MFS family permease
MKQPFLIHNMTRYSNNFWVICISMLLFMISFNLIMPELNGLLTSLGGAKWKGLIITIFTISAAISRPFSGKLSDYIGRKKVMFFGLLLCVFVNLLYPFTHSVFVFLLVRFIHGFTVGFTPTGATAMITDLLPIDKRGAGMGIWGTFISLGIGVGQVVGSPLASVMGVNILFYISLGLNVVSLLLLEFTVETLGTPKTMDVQFLRIQKRDVFEPSVLPSAFVMFLTSACSGCVFVLTPDISAYLGIENKGWFFFFYVAVTILVRLFTGKLSDTIGRVKSLMIGVSLLLVSMILLVNASSILSYTISSIVFGLATGINSPSLFAWTADLSHPDRKGVGAGTMFIALELGIMFGSICTLFTYSNTYVSASKSFFIGIITSCSALIYLVLTHRKSTKRIG